MDMDKEKTRKARKNIDEMLKQMWREELLAETGYSLDDTQSIASSSAASSSHHSDKTLKDFAIQPEIPSETMTPVPIKELVATEMKRLRLHETGEEEVSPPKNFCGRLAEGQVWKRCPYDKSHTYLSPYIHLLKCRPRYEAERQKRGLPMDIVICKNNWEHHIPVAELQEHEAFCQDQPVLLAYQSNYFERMRGRLDPNANLGEVAEATATGAGSQVPGTSKQATGANRAPIISRRPREDTRSRTSTEKRAKSK